MVLYVVMWNLITVLSLMDRNLMNTMQLNLINVEIIVIALFVGTSVLLIEG